MNGGTGSGELEQAIEGRNLCIALVGETEDRIEAMQLWRRAKGHQAFVRYYRANARAVGWEAEGPCFAGFE